MADVTNFRDLEVWAIAMDLAVAVYQLTDRFPRHEQFGLTAQTRRSAVSIAANVAEGHNRRVTGPYRNHVGIALGSQGELDTLLELSVRLRYSTEAEVAATRMLTSRVGQMLSKIFHALDEDGRDD